MVAALTLNGITLPSRGLSERPVFVGDLADRGVVGDFDENFVARKREFPTKLVAQTAALAIAFRKLLEGDGQSWRYDANTFSFKGEGPSAGGVYTQSGAGGVLGGGKVNVGSGSFIPYSLASSLNVPSGWAGAKGWSLLVRKVLTIGDGGDGVTFQRFIATGAVTVTAGTANPAGVTQYKNGAAGSFSMGAWMTIDGAGDGVVKLHGLSNAGASAAYDYCDFAFLPFALDPTWIAGLDTFLQTNRYPRLKRGILSGSQIEDSGGVEVHARCSDLPRKVRAPGGVHDASFRELTVMFWEA